MISRSDCTHQTPELLGPGKGTKHRPNQICASEGYLSVEPERLRPGRCTQPRAGLRRFPAEQHRAWVVCAREQGQAQQGWDTACTRQCYLFAASLPPHSATEQVSLKKKKYPLPPSLCQTEIRHWRDQQTGKFKQREPPWKWPHTAHNTRKSQKYLYYFYHHSLSFFFWLM